MALVDEADLKGEIALSVTTFKARCLEVFKALEAGRLTRVTVTKRGRPVGELRPPASERVKLYGAHPGSFTVAPGVDLVAPVLDEPLDAELGILHR